MELLVPKVGEFIPTLTAFVILLIVLGKFGWPAIVGMLDQRKATIKSDLEKAEASRIEGERVLEEYQEKLIQARQEAASIIAEAKQSAEAARAELSSKAQAEADDIIAKARVAIQSEKKAAIAELQGSVADLTVAVTARIIGEDLSDADHRKLIDRYIEEVGSLDA